jgi:hypothetical protein
MVHLSCSIAKSLEFAIAACDGSEGLEQKKDRPPERTLRLKPLRLIADSFTYHVFAAGSHN